MPKPVAPPSILFDNVVFTSFFCVYWVVFNIPEISIGLQVDSQWEIVEFWNDSSFLFPTPLLNILFLNVVLLRK
jgi:hypothetical protein